MIIFHNRCRWRGEIEEEGEMREKEEERKRMVEGRKRREVRGGERSERRDSREEGLEFTAMHPQRPALPPP